MPRSGPKTENNPTRIKILRDNPSVCHFTARALATKPAHQPVVAPSAQNPRPILMIDKPGEEFLASHLKDASIVYHLREAAVDMGCGDYWVVKSGLSNLRKGIFPDQMPDAIVRLRSWTPEEQQRYRVHDHYTRFRAGYLAITPPHERHVVYPIRFGPYEGALASWNLNPNRAKFQAAPQLVNVSGECILIGLFDTGCVVSLWSEWIAIDRLKIPGGYTGRVKRWIETYRVVRGWDQVHAKIIRLLNMPKVDDCAMFAKEVLDANSRLTALAEEGGSAGSGSGDDSSSAGDSDPGQGPSKPVRKNLKRDRRQKEASGSTGRVTAPAKTSSTGARTLAVDSGETGAVDTDVATEEEDVVMEDQQEEGGLNEREAERDDAGSDRRRSGRLIAESIQRVGQRRLANPDSRLSMILEAERSSDV